MDFRRMASVLAAVAVLAAACGGDDEDAGISVEHPIGAPGGEHSATAGPAAPGDPAVVKAASIDMDVPRGDLSSAAQQVIDIATSPRFGGFLVSSVVDTDGYGAGSVLVKVPAHRFEPAVAELGRVGEITRQQLTGTDVTPETATARSRVARARHRASVSAERVEESRDEDARAEAREALARVRQELREARRTAAAAGAEAAYSSIDVALEGEPPPPPPKKSTFAQAVDTAGSVSAGIASGIVLAAAVVLPVALLVLVLLLVGPRVIRFLKPRLRT